MTADDANLSASCIVDREEKKSIMINGSQTVADAVSDQCLMNAIR